MKKTSFFITAIFLGLFFAGCSSITEPLAATSNPIGSKVGEAKISLLFGIFPIGGNVDGGICAAAKNGGITTISTVDIKTLNWIIGTTRTTVVTGE